MYLPNLCLHNVLMLYGDLNSDDSGELILRFDVQIFSPGRQMTRTFNNDRLGLIFTYGLLINLHIRKKYECKKY